MAKKRVIRTSSATKAQPNTTTKKGCGCGGKK